MYDRLATTTPVDLRAVLVTGVFGSGKSSIAEEIADLLEGAGLPYALLDLDFLMWFRWRRRSWIGWGGSEDRRSR